jgi:hypothetical protein
MGRGDLVDLDDAGSDPVIAAQVARFAGLSRRWEWRHYSYDRPDLTLDVAPPAGMELREVAAVIASVGHVPVAPRDGSSSTTAPSSPACGRRHVARLAGAVRSARWWPTGLPWRR